MEGVGESHSINEQDLTVDFHRHLESTFSVQYLFILKMFDIHYILMIFPSIKFWPEWILGFFPPLYFLLLYFIFFSYLFVWSDRNNKSSPRIYHSKIYPQDKYSFILILLLVEKYASAESWHDKAVKDQQDISNKIDGMLPFCSSGHFLKNKGRKGKYAVLLEYYKIFICIYVFKSDSSYQYTVYLPHPKFLS